MVRSKNYFKNLKILIIEPSDEARNNMKQHFEKLGAVVYTVGKVDKIRSSIEGAIISGLPFELILVDVRLPNSYSFSVLKMINDSLNGFKAPIFVLSFEFGSHALRQMAQWGVMGYYRKPFSIDSLQHFLEERFVFFAERIETKRHHNFCLLEQKNKKNIQAA